MLEIVTTVTYVGYSTLSHMLDIVTATCVGYSSITATYTADSPHCQVCVAAWGNQSHGQNLRNGVIYIN
jgi:hypothetical protein